MLQPDRRPAGSVSAAVKGRAVLSWLPVYIVQG